MLWWMLALAHAHGPAPVALDVLAWSDEAGCDDVDVAHTPQLLRLNIGLAEHAGDGSYSYACPSRWGDEEQALAAGAPAGDEVLLAGSAGLWWSGDGGCSVDDLALPGGDVPVDLVWHDGGFLFASRRFNEGTSALWGVRGGVLTQVWSSSERWVDGLWAVPGGVWVAGARPTAHAGLWDGNALTGALTLPQVDGLQRLSPRAVQDGVLWLLATTDAGRALWRSQDGTVTEVLGPAEVIHGPAKVDDAWLAVIDGVLWVGDDDGDTWSATELVVDWTCLRTRGDRVIACSLPAMQVVTGWHEGSPSVVPVFSLDQLGAPPSSCALVDGQCELDWLHHAGESGLVDTLPATCPGEPRSRPIHTPDPEPEDCGCDQTGRGGMGLWLLAGLMGWRRRSPPSR